MGHNRDIIAPVFPFRECARHVIPTPTENGTDQWFHRQTEEEGSFSPNPPHREKAEEEKPNALPFRRILHCTQVLYIPIFGTVMH
mmetsp:Transcript_19735/g.46117  ORF Transcript_19735/g.46117 Transcript_19735/m.46117 type:complete len:85 (-) Transcript_19735:424-678(-)